MSIKKIYLIIIGFLTSILSYENLSSFRMDNRGGLVLPFSGKAENDEDWLEYKRLKRDVTAKSVNPKDLPNDFCDEACRLVDEFHRKTVNEKIEWVLYLDYRAGEVIYCWKGESGECLMDFEKINLFGRNIASIHNHTTGYYSFPSPENFDILENDFEDYEIITSENAFWTIEFKGEVNHLMRIGFQKFLTNEFENMMDDLMANVADVRKIHDIIEDRIGSYLLNNIDKKIQDIDLILIRKEYD